MHSTGMPSPPIEIGRLEKFQARFSIFYRQRVRFGCASGGLVCCQNGSVNSQSRHPSAFGFWLVIFSKPGCRIDTNATIRPEIEKSRVAIFLVYRAALLLIYDLWERAKETENQ